MLRSQTNHNKFKWTELVSSISSDHHNVKLEIKYLQKTGEIHKYVEINQQVTEQTMD